MQSAFFCAIVGAALDTDNPEHLEWVHVKAAERAKTYGIDGVDMRLTIGVLKRVIPAVASTNAIIASTCVLEAFKLLSKYAFFVVVIRVVR